MIAPGNLATVTAEAAVPEQVVQYVCSVAGLKPRMIHRCVGYESEGELVLVGYPLDDPLDEGSMARSIDEALQIPGLRRITVIGPARPAVAPDGCIAEQDCYFGLPVPAPPPGQKLRNLMRRADRELKIDRGNPWDNEHMALVRRFLDGRSLSPASRHIFLHLPRYLEGSSGSVLFSARLKDGRLAAFSVGEFSALRTAFYMFSCREPELAPPGTADLLLFELLEEARRRGQVRMNLGLGVNEGVAFFKRKWGAKPLFPYVHVSWQPASRGVFSRLRGLLRM